MKEIYDEQKINVLLAQNAIVETERLILRPVKIADAEDIFEYSQDEENVYYLYDKYESVEVGRARIASYFEKEPLGKYGIVLKENNKLVGTIDFRVNNLQGEIGYGLNKKYWGHGYVPEAARALIKLGFEIFHLPHIAASCLEENHRSARVMQKCGMQLEARRPKTRLFHNKWITECEYGITDDEYFSGVDQHHFEK